MFPNQDRNVNNNEYKVEVTTTTASSCYQSATMSIAEVGMRLHYGKKTNRYARECLYCGNIAELVWVHGHGQCARCGTNIDECCRGEQCEGG